ncbi:class I adenylate-forming enzyme family protein [Streptomyces sp. CB03911]|uniref:class I adenylate-forming enzyme family protein n=1 Tax=Streptomycetaceae TaxID=2062 RepID=UPI00093B5FA8|nr:class I adenylate-forming enzyme family protein [Streptomyces sp. CB03911]OKI17590.1 AMP-dependent synthetase [Streptomyces sp. CB03911]
MHRTRSGDPGNASARTSAGTVHGLLEARAQAQPDRVAIATDDGRSLTFAAWHQRSTAVAHALAGRGIRPGDRVGLLFGLRSWPEFALAYCAVTKAGAVAVPVSDRQPAEAVRRLLGHCGAAGLIAAAESARPEGPWWTGHLEELETEVPADPADLPQVTAADLAQVLYTSGTTGRPKGVAATHGNLTYGTRPTARHRPLAHSEQFLHSFAVGTNAGQTMLLNALDAHAAALVATHFTPGRFARLIEQRSVGSVFVVPAMAAELLHAKVHTRFDLSSVRLLGSTAAALPPKVATGLTEAFPRATVVNYYTSTEAAPAQTAMIYDPARPTALGRPAQGAVMVAGPDGRPLPPGESGDVHLRSPGSPRHYYRDAEAGAEVFRTGWVRMGDIGFLDQDGYLHLVDRESDVIKSGAHKVSTLQVEAAALEHPAVAEVAVVGLPHPVLGMSVAAVVVPAAGRPFDAAELRAFLAGRLAAHEIPTRITTLGELPRNEGGKPLKRALRDLLAAPA